MGANCHPAVFLAAVLASAAAHAQPDCDARVEATRRTLNREASRARTWRGGWQLGLSAVTVGQVAALPFVGEGDRVDLAIGSASSLFGLVSLTVMSPTVIADAATFEKHASEPGVPTSSWGRPSHTRGDSCALADEGQLFLDRGAADQARSTGFLAHAGNAVFNLALGALLGWGLGHWESAAANVALGTLVGEVMILTQPTGLVSAPRRGLAFAF